MVKSGGYTYPDVKIINFWMGKTDLLMLNSLREKLLTNRKKTYAFVIREALLYANAHMDDFIKESIKRWG